MLAGIGVVGVDLHGEVVVGVEDLDEQREPVVCGPLEQLVVARPQGREGLAGELALSDLAVAVGVGRYRSALPYRTCGYLVAKLGLKPSASPDLLYEDGLEVDGVVLGG